MTAVGTFIPKIFEEHLESAGLLWARRRSALREWESTRSNLQDLEDLIDAHLEGLSAAGEDAFPILEAELKGDAPPRAFAATFALLRLGSPEALHRVLDAFADATEARLEAIRDALAHGPAASLASQLMSHFVASSPPVAAAAGEALAFHGMLTPTAAQLERLVRAKDMGARASVWRIVGYCGITVPPEWYAEGLRDDDPAVKRAVFETAAWNRSPEFYRYARSLAAAPTPELLESIALFAAVAPPEEYELIGAVAANAAAGPNRYRVIASFGHPYFIPFLIDEMARPDPVAAARAAAAFERMTDRPVQSTLKKKAPSQTAPADGGDEEPAAFVPNSESAEMAWAELAPRLAYAPRIARGMDVSQTLSRDQLAVLDRESLWEYCLRMRLFSGWQGTPLVLERYPQRL
jgi:uncharacterized protein (TIGR02270 family)